MMLTLGLSWQWNMRPLAGLNLGWEQLKLVPKLNSEL